MADLPAGVSTGIVRVDLSAIGHVGAADLDLEHEPITGSVVFVPTATQLLHEPSGKLLVHTPSSAEFDGTSTVVPVELLATDNETLVPSGWTYEVRFLLDGVYLERFHIAVPSGSDEVLGVLAPPGPDLSGWNLVRVYATWVKHDNRKHEGTYTVSVSHRLTNSVDDTIIPAGVFAAGRLDTRPDVPSLDILVPATDDPDIIESGWTITISVNFPEPYRDEKWTIEVPLATPPPGINLRSLVLPDLLDGDPADVFIKLGEPGGVALLNDAGFVVNADGSLPGVGASSGVIVHEQMTPAATWTVTNALARPCAAAIIIDGELVEADVAITTEYVVVSFPSPQQGTLVLN